MASTTAPKYSTGYAPSDPETTIIVPDGGGYPSQHFVLPPQYKQFVSRVLVPNGTIVDRIEKLAEAIYDDYVAKGKTPHILAVLKGGHAFFTELTRAIGRRQLYSSNVRVPFTFDFIRAKSYDGTASSGEVKVTGVRVEDLAGRNVILVEDIIDSGLTMSILVPMLEKSCTSVAVATLIAKRNPKAVGFRAQYIGFEVEDAFLVGYNLDYNEAFRELDHLCVINAKGVAAFKDFDDGTSANSAAVQAGADAANAEAAE